jgi:hypothetical protein
LWRNTNSVRLLIIVCVVPYVAAQAAIDVESVTVDCSTYMPSLTIVVGLRSGGAGSEPRFVACGATGRVR